MNHLTRFSLIVAASCALAACGQEQAATSSAAPGAEATKAAAAQPLRLYVIDCGSMQADPARFRLQASEIATNVLSTPCFLVVHPSGSLVWDVGSVPDGEWMPTGSPGAHHLTLPDNSTRALALNKPL